MFVRIIVSGGFHNVEEKEFLAFETDSGLWLRETTASKMQRYACGISDCCCGGWTDAGSRTNKAILFALPIVTHLVCQKCSTASKT